MLRPATPLSAVLFVAFALILLSVLSTPIIEAIPLSTFEDVSFGVFGFCDGGDCTSIQIGYDVTGLFDNANAFDLPEGVRNTLSSVLIIHAVAAFLTLVLFIMAVAAHFHSPSHSSRYLLIIFIVSCLDFVVCMATFLIDVLVFIPHLAWGTYIVLAGTILVGLSGLVSCAMRRTLISRKSRKNRIAENAEMSGENYYNRENQVKAAAAAAAASSQPTVPTISGGNGGDNLPQFASYEDQKREDQVSDERIPLTTRSPTDRSLGSVPPTAVGPLDDKGYGNVPPSRAASVPRPQQDQYGNPINAPQDAYGVRRMPSSETNRSFDRANSRGRGGMPPPGYRGGRGRGGYNRGGYGPPPPLAGRGGYGPRGRGGYGGPPPGPRGGYGPRGRGGPYAAGPPGPMMSGRASPGYHNEPGPYDRRGSPAEPYAAAGTSDYSATNGANSSQPGYDAYNPESMSLPRAESPPPLPYEESAGPQTNTTGNPGQAPRAYDSFGAVSDTDTDIAGMVGLQQDVNNNNQGRHDTYMSEGSKYSTDEQYVPPRQAWAQGQGRNSPHAPSPLGSNRGNSPAQVPPSNNYYEDVDPRFASSRVDSAMPPPLQTNAPPPPQESYEDGREQRSARARSPGAESDRSNFTSISQRGVNPRWNPPPPMPGYGGQPMPRRPPPQRQQDVLLNNPDFELPNRVGSPPRGGGGMVPGSAYPGGI